MSKAPILFTNLEQWRAKRRELGDISLGFVPTMGALHEGHASLMRRARKENDFTLLSIYVNPTQFDDPKDLQKYPSTLENDQKIAAASDVDFILAPNYEQMYPDQYAYRVSENSFSRELCGAHRPGHFDGVLSVVMKLLNLAQCRRAYFGEKDFQQLTLIDGMVRAFFMPTEIVPCPIVREADGLALSSRNMNLPAEARALAPRFYKALTESASAEAAIARLQKDGFEVDYVEDQTYPGDRRRLGAVRIGGVRLIDNVER